MVELTTKNSKSLAESIPPYARWFARIAFITLWDCAGLLLCGSKSEKDFALERLENIKQNYENIKEEPLCLRTPYGKDMLKYFNSSFENHQTGKFYQTIKNARSNNNLKELYRIYNDLEKIVNEFHTVYHPQV